MVCFSLKKGFVLETSPTFKQDSSSVAVTDFHHLEKREFNTEFGHLIWVPPE